MVDAVMDSAAGLGLTPLQRAKFIVAISETLIDAVTPYVREGARLRPARPWSASEGETRCAQRTADVAIPPAPKARTDATRRSRDHGGSAAASAGVVWPTPDAGIRAKQLAST